MPELNSPQETLLLFENLLKILSKSGRLLEKVKSSPHYLKFHKLLRTI